MWFTNFNLIAGTLEAAGVRNLVLGALAGAAGTVVMDLLWYQRYRREGGKDSLWRWESAGAVMSWAEAPAPGRLGEKVARAILRREPPDEWARAATNINHWAAGVSWGLLYGALAGSTNQSRSQLALGLGPVAWLTSYVVLPLAGVYEPIWKYDARTLSEDLSAHVLFGVGTGAAFAGLGRAR